MRYLADILTSIRFVLGLSLLSMVLFGGGSIEAAFIIFVIAELTDAFDGTCARKWPFPKNKTPKYRRYAAKFDMVSDALLWCAAVLFLMLRVDFFVGLLILWVVTVVACVVELIVYGKLFGHPDDCTKNSLCKRNFPLAKKIIMARRWLYLATIFLIAIWLLFATAWPLIVKIVIILCAALICVFLWFFLEQRRKNISRDAVGIEKTLSQKTQQQKKPQQSKPEKTSQSKKTSKPKKSSQSKKTKSRKKSSKKTKSRRK